MKQITKDIRQYLHLYYGQECRCYSTWDADGWLDRVTPELLIDINDEDSEVGGCHLILRRLSSMTEEEKEKLFDAVFPKGWMTQSINLSGKTDFINYYVNLEAVNNSDLFDQIVISMDFKHHVKMINWLRENKFDADELIDSGLALDKDNL